MAEYNNQWQNIRDMIEYAFTAGENYYNRQNTLAIAVLGKEATIKAAEYQMQGNMYEALGQLGAKVYEGGGFSNTLGSISNFAKEIKNIFSTSSSSTVFDPMGGLENIVVPGVDDSIWDSINWDQLDTTDIDYLNESSGFA